MKKILLAFIRCFVFYDPGRAAETDYPPLTGPSELTKPASSPRNKSRSCCNCWPPTKQSGGRCRGQRPAGTERTRIRDRTGPPLATGTKGQDNGVLILLSPKDRYAGIEVGYGLEDILPDSLTGRILRQEVFPPLQRNLDYGTALLNGTKAVMTVLAGGEPGLADEEASPLEDAASTLLTLLMIYLILSGRGRFWAAADLSFAAAAVAAAVPRRRRRFWRRWCRRPILGILNTVRPCFAPVPASANSNAKINLFPPKTLKATTAAVI